MNGDLRKDEIAHVYNYCGCGNLPTRDAPVTPGIRSSDPDLLSVRFFWSTPEYEVAELPQKRLAFLFASWYDLYTRSVGVKRLFTEVTPTERGRRCKERQTDYVRGDEPSSDENGGKAGHRRCC